MSQELKTSTPPVLLAKASVFQQLIKDELDKDFDKSALDGLLFERGVGALLEVNQGRKKLEKLYMESLNK